MKILFAVSEAYPLVKTGGLGDVGGSLPVALRNLGHDVRVIMPAYRGVADQAQAVVCRDFPALPSAIGPVRLLEGRLPETRVKLYLVDAPAYFDRPGGPYAGADGNDWPDNAARFALFCRAVTACARDQLGLSWQPQIVHCHDWQTGLVPALLALQTPRPITIFTIHNLAYQGVFDASAVQALALPAAWWQWDALEFHGRLSFIKGGLVFADWLTTVSPNYADEILTPEFGYGLDGLLRYRQDRLLGVLNGADYALWSPAHDPHVRHPYSARNLQAKALNKIDLQKECGLLPAPDVPLLAHTGRLVEQKGIDLLLDVLPAVLQQNTHVVLLGSGEPRFESALRAAAARYPEQLCARIGYDEALAHRIEAGADMFIMPSRFEPCGLNQIYSLRYGTVPVVRRTGGLADSVIDVSVQTLADKTATGFLFDDAAPAALGNAVQRALDIYQRPSAWRTLMRQGMRQDFSWKRSARVYTQIYARAVADQGA